MLSSEELQSPLSNLESGEISNLTKEQRKEAMKILVARAKKLRRTREAGKLIRNTGGDTSLYRIKEEEVN